MKKTVLLLFGLICAGLLAACTGILDISKLEKSPYDAANQSTLVAMTADAPEVAADASVQFTFVNASDTEYAFGLEPHLEIFSEGGWYVIPPREDAAWNDIAMILAPGGTAEYTLDLKFMYEDLPTGQYRLVKELYAEEGTFVTAQFKIQ